MCGIVGLVAARGEQPPNARALARAVASLQHRGPDGHGTYVHGAAALGHTRLSIIDPEGGAQPLANEDGSVVVVFNGEIWNHLRLRRLLEAAGHRFRTRADTEVIVHGYEQWQDDVVDHLDGMFAFAIWGAQRERLLLARDRVGKKPLYVAHLERGLAFGSDVRALLVAAERTPALDERNVPEFLFQRYVGGDRTLFRDVKRVLPGELLVYDRDRLSHRRYWQLQPSREPRRLSAGSLRTLLRGAVQERLMSDVPLGVLLSGGVDSTAVLGLMREAGADSVASFTIGFDNPLYDERARARAAARRHGSDHHEIVVSASDFAAALPRLAWLRDEPIAEPSEIPLLLLAEEVARHVKVVLTGDGGDELFGGYPKYRLERLLRAPVPFAAPALRAAVLAAATRPTHRRLSRAAATLRISDELVRWASWFRTFEPADLTAVVAPRLRDAASADAVRDRLHEVVARHAAVDPGRRMLLADFATYLPDNMLVRGDKVLMAASVEGRMPLLARQVVERVSDAPASQRSGLRTSKALLRRAVEDLVPREILNGAKLGFPVPVADMLLAADGAGLQRLATSERTLSRGLFDAGALRLLTEDRSIPDRELKLFTMVMLELWLRTSVDRVTLGPPASLADVLEQDELDAPLAA